MRTLLAAAAALILANQAALAELPNDAWMTPPGCVKMPTATLFYCNGASPTGEGPPIPEPKVEHRHHYAHHASHYWHPKHWRPTWD